MAGPEDAAPTQGRESRDSLVELSHHRRSPALAPHEDSNDLISNADEEEEERARGRDHTGEDRSSQEGAEESHVIPFADLRSTSQEGSKRALFQGLFARQESKKKADIFVQVKAIQMAQHKGKEVADRVGGGLSRGGGLS